LTECNIRASKRANNQGKSKLQKQGVRKEKINATHESINKQQFESQGSQQVTDYIGKECSNECYICGAPGHIAKNCKYKGNLYSETNRNVTSDEQNKQEEHIQTFSSSSEHQSQLEQESEAIL